ncbi:unnamed protein product [Strongylus vulgaris]|uniref:Uncharacterized protein n=1 Tax=Strongylus vulgaris TaxID=40348 RepID=A0A3P7L6U9_STRVU|nr:unnamed protein product [Strongylus vulgaris]
MSNTYLPRHNVAFVKLALQHVFAVVLSADSFKELVKSKSLEDFVTCQKLSYSLPNPTLIIIIFGKQSRNLFDLSISLFDYYRTQLNYVNNAKEFATYLAQISRALAKLEKPSGKQDRLIVDVEKGVKDAAPEELIRDWWNKMLAVIARMHDAHRRAIIAAYPNPIVASKRFAEMGYARAVKELTELRSESGRRLGPVMAHRLFMILTDGVKDAAPEELIRDWWNKMLAVIARMHDAHRRAIIAAYPNPIVASKRFAEMGYARAVKELTELRSESGRRLGPVMAHRLFMILTDVTGREIVA